MSWSNTPVPPNQSTITAEVSGKAETLAGPTPVIGDGTNPFTGITGTVLSTQVYNLVFVSIDVSWTGKGSASGTIQIDLP